MTFATHTYPQRHIQNGTTQIQRGLLLFLTWLFIGPLATNVITMIDPKIEVIAMETDQGTSKRMAARDGFFAGTSSATVTQLLEPTRVIVSLFVIVFLLTAVVRHNLGSFDKTELLMTAFSLVLLISVLFKSKVLGFSVRMATDAFVVPFLVYFIARRLITDEHRFRQLIRSIAYMGLYVILFSFVERAMHEGLFYNLKGPFHFSASLYFAMMIVFFVVLSEHVNAGPFRGRSEVFPRCTRLSVLYLAPIIIFLGWSRGNWLGFITGLCLFIFLGRRLLNRSMKFALIGVALVLSAMMSFGIEIFAETLESRIANLHTIYGRIATWTVAIESGLKSPIFGIGLNNLREVLATNIAEFEGVRNFPRVHNSYLAILAEQGIVGLFLYLAMVVSMMRVGMGLYRAGFEPRDVWRGVAVLAIMAAYFLPAMFAATIHVHIPLTHVFVYAFCGAVAGRYGQVRAAYPLRTSQSVALASR
jgi:O-antigen ligase